MSERLFDPPASDEAPNWAAEREERGEERRSTGPGAHLPLAPPRPGNGALTASSRGYLRLMVEKGLWPGG